MEILSYWPICTQGAAIGRTGAREMLVKALAERRKMGAEQVADAMINRRFAEVGLERVDEKVLDTLVRRFEEVREARRR